METTDLVVEVRDTNLNRVGQLVLDDLDGLTIATRANAVGSWQIALPDTILDPTTGKLVPHALCLALRTEGAGLVVTGPTGVIISGPMTESQFEASSTDPAGTWTITGASDMILLQDALAYPDPATADPTAQRFANDVRTGAAETLLRSYVAFNICNGAIATGGALSWAPAGRLVGLRSKLRLQGPGAGRGPTLAFSPRFDNLLELCQNIAVAGGLTFDVVQNGSYLELVVSQPVDRSPYVRMDIDNQQLATVDFGYGSPTATRPIVGGDGDGTARTIVERTNSPVLAAEALWGRRIETFVDQRQTSDLSQLQQAGDAILTAQGVTIPSMKVTPSDDLAMIYMRDWFLGDVVAVTVGVRQVTATVTEAAIAVNNGVLVGATVGDPTGFESSDVQASRITSTEARVSSLERNAESGGMPSGALTPWAGSAAPAGWLTCDGSAVSRVTYPALFAAVGTTYGAGDGSTTFNLPNMKGRTPVGVDATQTEFATRGQLGGEKTHTLTVGEMPSHSHNPPVAVVYNGNASQYRSLFATNSGFWSPGDSNNAVTPTGGGGAHNNLQPYVALNYIIKT